MGSNKSKTRRSASRPAGGPRTSPQPAATGYVGPSPVAAVPPLDTAAVLPPVVGASADDPYALVGWGSASGIGGAEDLRCPSGQLALVRRPGVQGLIEAGVLHDVDSLTGLVDQKHIKRVKGTGPQINTASLLKDPKNLARVMKVVDAVVVHSVVKPRVSLAWKEDAQGQQVPLTEAERQKARDEGAQVFTDQVELDDKMFIMNYAVGGTRNLERFRDLTDDALAGVADGDTVEGEAQ